jgi:hypothetical protein
MTSAPGVLRAEDDPARAPAAPPAYSLQYRWHTFHGAAGSLGEPRGVAADAAGNVYVAGYSDTSWGSPLHAYSGDYDVLVMKLSNQGDLVWHTYYGASSAPAEDGHDEASAIAVDESGNVYVTGYSDRAWLGPGGAAPLHPHGGDDEYMFVLKLSSEGAYQWHAFYQAGRAEAIDAGGGRVVAAGNAKAAWGSPRHPFGGNLVVLALDSGGGYEWHTYYGAGQGASDETAYGVAVDAGRNAVYVAGTAPDTWLGDGNAPPVHDFSGGAGYSTDIAVVKLDSGGHYQWHTFHGAADSDDIGYGVAVGGDGTPIVAGQSFDGWGAPLRLHSGERDIVALKLGQDGARLWHTFYGSPANDTGAGIAADGQGNAYVAGRSAVAWLGENGAGPAHPHSGGLDDIAVLKLDASGAYVRHTFYGAGDADDQGAGIAIGGDRGQREVFVTGLSAVAWQGDSGANPRHAHSGNLAGDACALKLSDRQWHVHLPVIAR